MKFTVITLFPNIINEYINTSIIGRAKDSSKIEIDVIDLREFGKGKRKNVDDTVYGGGSRNGYFCACFRPGFKLY